jgi:hypothetical protein
MACMAINALGLLHLVPCLSIYKKRALHVLFFILLVLLILENNSLFLNQPSNIELRKLLESKKSPKIIILRIVLKII